VTEQETLEVVFEGKDANFRIFDGKWEDGLFCSLEMDNNLDELKVEMEEAMLDLIFFLLYFL
jgi:hypothetical protein